MSDGTKPGENDGRRSADEEREAVLEHSSAQDLRVDREAAESRPALGDDRVTPRLNDGR